MIKPLVYEWSFLKNPLFFVNKETLVNYNHSLIQAQHAPIWK